MKNKEIVLLLGSVLVIVVAWIAFSIYHNLITSTTPEDLEKEATPINPLFDESTINKLKERQQATPLFEVDTSVQIPTEDISSTFEPTPISSPSPTGTSLAPTASPGGQLAP
ncbi:MAG: hypothetical protein A2687_00110 [Candidatus Levybacteria bacterium RIFCSPHIGHO2_01_FULL_38_26]|nr:MAG: hypothetical protein A2687_00110 [Candidatus Levybacteria bacterium RIFCSPHIGHO2_01_FULL_38_26]